MRHIHTTHTYTHAYDRQIEHDQHNTTTGLLNGDKRHHHQRTRQSPEGPRCLLLLLLLTKQKGRKRTVLNGAGFLSRVRSRVFLASSSGCMFSRLVLVCVCWLRLRLSLRVCSARAPPLRLVRSRYAFFCRRAMDGRDEQDEQTLREGDYPVLCPQASGSC